MLITQLVLKSKTLIKLGKFQARPPLMFFTVFFIGAIIGDSSLCNWNNANYRILRDITAFHHTLPHFTTLIFNIMFSRYDSLGARYQNIKSFHAPRHNFLFLFKFQISSSGQSQNF